MIQHPNRIRRLWLSLALLLMTAASPAGARGLPAQNGIINFGKVNEQVYRGAQPDVAGVSNLKQLGVKSIIDLRMPGEAWELEPTQSRENGILYTNVPLKGLGRPQDDAVRKLITLIETLPAPVFIHCKHGCDRTGTIVACYRIQHDRWSAETALQEARKHGLSVWERGMRRYVLDFARQIK